MLETAERFYCGYFWGWSVDRLWWMSEKLPGLVAGFIRELQSCAKVWGFGTYHTLPLPLVFPYKLSLSTSGVRDFYPSSTGLITTTTIILI